MKRLPGVDRVDLASLPYFAITMVAEGRALAKHTTREPGSLLEPSDPGTDPDPLIPVGFERRDTVASLAMLVGNIAVNTATRAPLARLGERLFRRRVFGLRSGPGSFIAALVVWDLLYYWSHRLQHEHRVLWANHVTHHSSRRYNLSTALRQPWSGFLVSWVYFPMPLLGIPVAQTARSGQLNLLYQYWIHTEAIDRLPSPVERVFNTPSHHRVHHGTNPQYLDKNYGGILIVWDKLFGTFEPEVRRVDYGLTTNVSTFNPVRIAYHEFSDIWRDLRATPGLADKLRTLWRRPGWRPEPT